MIIASNFQFHPHKTSYSVYVDIKGLFFFCRTAAANVLKMVFSLQRELSQQRLTFNKRHISTMPLSQEQHPPHNAHPLMTATFSQRFDNLNASRQLNQKPD